MLPRLRGVYAGAGGGRMDTECVDLLGELLAIYEFIVLTPNGDESAEARATYAGMATIMRSQDAPTEDCHTAVVYMFSKGALEKSEQG